MELSVAESITVLYRNMLVSIAHVPSFCLTLNNRYVLHCRVLATRPPPALAPRSSSSSLPHLLTITKRGSHQFVGCYCWFVYEDTFYCLKWKSRTLSAGWGYINHTSPSQEPAASQTRRVGSFSSTSSALVIIGKFTA